MLDPSTRTAKVRCTFDNAGQAAAPEMYATVQISVDQKKAARHPAQRAPPPRRAQGRLHRGRRGPRPREVPARRRSTSTRASRASGSRSSTASSRARRSSSNGAILLVAEALQCTRLSQVAPMIQRIVAGALRMPVRRLRGGGPAHRARARRVQASSTSRRTRTRARRSSRCITQPPGWSAEETERYVTIPLEIGLSGMPGLDHIRSQSLFGLSDVKCYFNWGTEYKDARQEVINRLQFVAAARRASRRSSRRGTPSARCSATASSARATRSRT